MTQLKSPNSQREQLLSDDNRVKIQQSLLKHVYDQTLIGLASSLFCATIFFISQIDLSKSNLKLFIWAGLFLFIILIRMGLIIARKYLAKEKNGLWETLYIVGSLLGGMSWGLTGILFLSDSSSLQQMILILMLAGVTAGAVPLYSGVLRAAIVFLITSILPFIITIALFEDKMWVLFNITATIYLGYTIILSVKTYNILRSSTILKFENDTLLHDLEISNTKLQQASNHDMLTSLPNRRYFEEKIQQALEKAKANNKLVALLYIDLDHFKEANDTFGHHAGDAILLTVTQRLLDYLRNEDQIARLGGDELVVLIENITLQTLPHIKEVAKRICQLIAIPIPHGDITLKISASIGISIYPVDGTDEFLLLKTADKRMYKVKKLGGDNFEIGTEETFLS